MMRNIKQNLALTFIYNLIGIPIPAGVLLPDVPPRLSPMLAHAAMRLSAVSVVSNPPQLRRIRLVSATIPERLPNKADAFGEVAVAGEVFGA
jgi:cation transport ATPase